MPKFFLLVQACSLNFVLLGRGNGWVQALSLNRRENN